MKRVSIALALSVAVAGCGPAPNPLEETFRECIESGGGTVHSVEATFDNRGQLVAFASSVDASDALRDRCYDLVLPGF